MNNQLKIVRAGFGFGIVPFVLLLLGSVVMYLFTFLGDGNLDGAPIAPSTTVAMLMMFVSFGVMLALAGIAFASSLQLAKRIGGRMPEGAVAVVLGTLFAVALTAAVPLMRPLAVGIGCSSEASLLRTICATDALLQASQQASNVFSAVVLLMLGYAAVVGLVIGGMVAETHDIVVVGPVKPQAIPAHMLRKPALTRDEWLRKFAEEKDQQ
jgi:hypothetical protein